MAVNSTWFTGSPSRARTYNLAVTATFRFPWRPDYLITIHFACASVRCRALIRVYWHRPPHPIVSAPSRSLENQPCVNGLGSGLPFPHQRNQASLNSPGFPSRCFHQELQLWHEFLDTFHAPFYSRSLYQLSYRGITCRKSTLSNQKLFSSKSIKTLSKSQLFCQYELFSIIVSRLRFCSILKFSWFLALF